MKHIDKALEVLKQYFGYDSFRPMQDEIIESIMEQRDTVVIMPTGGGKSLCFQIPALLLPGVCLVVSPLIALMKDQVDGLQVNGVPAEYLNSSQGDHEQHAVLEKVRMGETKILYVSPEKLLSSHMLSFLGIINVSMIAIDEAHCISAWGHDFRPEYTQMGFFKQRFPSIPIVALTATADKITRRDIVSQLNLASPAEFLASFDRPNLSLNVLHGKNRASSIVNFIQDRPNTAGIIYCLSRKGTESLAARLKKEGISATYYHAGMRSEERARVQQQFLSDNVDVMCATVAFGMGIDKSNVRWVIHYNMPKNIEGYYQEIGRAGRDGLASDTLLFYSYADIITLRSFIADSGQPELQTMKLDRMQQYADALVCRRKVLLAYFGEHLDKSCGNCDVCKNPPKYVDGTVMAQKALSAIYRLNGEVGLNTLVDVLRGSSRREIVEKGYDQIKTYGVGSEVSAYDWQQYIHQMINIGLIEVAYDQGSILKLSPVADDVLFQQAKVDLYQLSSVKERIKGRKELGKVKTKAEKLAERFFAAFRELRLGLASRVGVAPDRIFTDATLIELADKRPTTPTRMKMISGVSEAKFRQYGHVFMEETIRLVVQFVAEGERIKGSTYLITYDCIHRGDTPAFIAQTRQLSLNTIYSHLQKLYTEGYDIPISRLVSAQEVKEVYQALIQLGSEASLGSVIDYLANRIDTVKVGLLMSYVKNTRLTADQ